MAECWSWRRRKKRRKHGIPVPCMFVVAFSLRPLVISAEGARSARHGDGGLRGLTLPLLVRTLGI